MQIDIALLGFGNVGRALAALLLEKEALLAGEFGITCRVTGIATGSRGYAIDPGGVDLRRALWLAENGGVLDVLHVGPSTLNTLEFVANCPAGLVFEASPTDPNSGEPALSYVRLALERGIHVVTANKGPIAFGYRELDQLAARQGVGLFFESTVLGGSPVISLAREGLAAADIRRISGVFNSTTNFILDRMEREHLSFEAALKEAQDIGVAETDPTLDIDGWDASIKTVILANVCMGADLRPGDVLRTGIRDISAADIAAAAAAGERIRLLCQAERRRDGIVDVSVAPRRVSDESLAGRTFGTGSYVTFELDTMGMQTLIDEGQGPKGTAYGMLVDMINALRGRAAKRAG